MLYVKMVELLKYCFSYVNAEFISVNYKNKGWCRCYCYCIYSEGADFLHESGEMLIIFFLSAL